MFINIKKLKSLKGNNTSKECLALVRYLESISYLYDLNEPIPNNIVRIPCEFSDELINNTFLEISEKKPYLIVHSTHQKLCYF